MRPNFSGLEKPAGSVRHPRFARARKSFADRAKRLARVFRDGLWIRALFEVLFRFIVRVLTDS